MMGRNVQEEDTMSLPRVTVWNEFIHETEHESVRAIYPDGIHGCIRDFLKAAGHGVQTATLIEPEHGLSDEVLDKTDVLIWWGHVAHHKVEDEIVERVWRRVVAGMGLIVLHSGHASKIFRKVCGTPTGFLRWREAGDWRGVGTANMEFHKAIVALADSERLNDMFTHLLAELRLAFGLLDDPEFLHAPYVDSNVKIIDLFEAGQPQEAAAALGDYLVHSERIVLAAYARRIAGSGAGR